jgi:hypothetical protein
MTYYIFSDINEFNEWHETIMGELGIPDGLGTIEYTIPMVHPINGSVVCTIDERANMNNRPSLNRDEMYNAGYKERPTPLENL